MTLNRSTPPLRIYLIRLGETLWSVSCRHRGKISSPLSVGDESEARELSGRLRNVFFDRVLSSPRNRSAAACELVVAERGFEIEPDLKEWDYGAYEGLHRDEIVRRRPSWNLFRDGCPEGELPEAVGRRADLLIRRLRGLSGNIALFTHGHFGRVLAVRWIGFPVSAALHLQLGAEPVCLLEYDSLRPTVPILTRWNPALPRPAPLLPDVLQRWENEGGRGPGSASLEPTLPSN